MQTVMRWFILSGIHLIYWSRSLLLAACFGKENGAAKWYFCLKTVQILADVSSFNDVLQNEAKSSVMTGYSRCVNGQAIS
jgi:hypothetical protein